MTATVWHPYEYAHAWIDGHPAVLRRGGLLRPGVDVGAWHVHLTLTCRTEGTVEARRIADLLNEAGDR